MPQQLQAAHLQAFAQQAHLAAAVVEVVLAGDLPAGGRQQVGDGVAQHRAPGVADGQRAGGVGADELDLRLAAFAGIGVAEGLGRGLDHLDLLGQPGVGQGEVDEAGRHHVGLAQEIGRGQAVDDLLGDLDRRHLGRPGRLHGDVGRVVAVLRVFGMLDGEGRQVKGRQVAGFLGLFDGLLHERDKVVFNHAAMFS